MAFERRVRESKLAIWISAVVATLLVVVMQRCSDAADTELPMYPSPMFLGQMSSPTLVLAFILGVVACGFAVYRRSHLFLGAVSIGSLALGFLWTLWAIGVPSSSGFIDLRLVRAMQAGLVALWLNEVALAGQMALFVFAAARRRSSRA